MLKFEFRLEMPRFPNTFGEEILSHFTAFLQFQRLRNFKIVILISEKIREIKFRVNILYLKYLQLLLKILIHS